MKRHHWGAKLLWLAMVVVLALAASAVDRHESSVLPAGSQMLGGVPAMYFGVEACKTQIYWLVMQDGRMYRLDMFHEPNELDRFLSSIKPLPHDTVTIPCVKMVT